MPAVLRRFSPAAFHAPCRETIPGTALAPYLAFFSRCDFRGTALRCEASCRLDTRSGSGKSEHCALSLPINGKAVQPRELLPIKLNRLPPVENGSDDIRR